MGDIGGRGRGASVPARPPGRDGALLVAGLLNAEDQLGPFVRDGRITVMPSRPAKRRLLLDCVAQAFEPGHRYPEAAVDDVLKALTDDHPTLRRYLVDEGFMSRQAGMYWRSGGTYDPGGAPRDPAQPPGPPRNVPRRYSAG
jgi:hypothetical protein